MTILSILIVWNYLLVFNLNTPYYDQIHSLGRINTVYAYVYKYSISVCIDIRQVVKVYSVYASIGKNYWKEDDIYTSSLLTFRLQTPIPILVMPCKSLQVKQKKGQLKNVHRTIKGTNASKAQTNYTIYLSDQHRKNKES